MKHLNAQMKFMKSVIDANLHIEITGNKLKSDARGITNVSIYTDIWVKDTSNISSAIKLQNTKKKPMKVDFGSDDF